MSKRPDLVVLTPPPSQPIANKAHEILQKAHDAILFLEMEAMNAHYAEDDALNAEKQDFTASDEEQDEWLDKRSARVIANSRMEGLWRDLHNTVRKIKSGIGAVEYYR
jgi:hypothetical protein